MKQQQLNKEANAIGRKLDKSGYTVIKVMTAISDSLKINFPSESEDSRKSALLSATILWCKRNIGRKQ